MKYASQTIELNQRLILKIAGIFGPKYVVRESYARTHSLFQPDAGAEWAR